MARWLVALAVGCTHDEPGSDGAPPADSGTAPCARGDLALALGTGVFAYEPLTDGEPVTINHGPDGGWHVWTAVDLANSGPDVSLHPVMTIPDLGNGALASHEARLCVTAIGLVDGRSATDCRTVTLESDPIDASVCAGSSSR